MGAVDISDTAKAILLLTISRNTGAAGAFLAPVNRVTGSSAK